MTAPAWVILTDHDMAIRFVFDNSHCMDFKVYECVERDLRPNSRWELSTFNDDRVPFSEWENAFDVISGGLKWDGCINWQTNPACMMHGCGKDHINALGAIFQTVYAIGKLHMNLLGEDPPPMPPNALVEWEA